MTIGMAVNSGKQHAQKKYVMAEGLQQLAKAAKEVDLWLMGRQASGVFDELAAQLRHSAAQDAPEVVQIFEDGFLCICGNTEDLISAQHCDSEGRPLPMPPNIEPGDLFVCELCGRIFNGTEGTVFGRRRPTMVLQFPTTTELHYFLNEHFPERQCEEAPGCYTVTDGTLGVFCETLTLYGETLVKRFENIDLPKEVQRG